MDTASPIVSRRRAAPARGAAADSKSPEKQECMESHRLLLWEELPEWQREDNSHVESGYRIATPSVLRCFKSWFYLHNESGIRHLASPV